MSRLRALCLLLAWFCVACSSGSGGSSGGYAADHVVVLVLDGPRQSEMWADPSRANIPELAHVLAPQGTLLQGFRNNGPTYTNSGHTALVTGFYEDIENVSGTQLPSHAGLFQRFLQATGLPADQAWIITSKDKLAILGDTTESGWQGRYQPSRWCGAGGAGPGSGYGDDADTLAEAKAVISSHHPRLMLVSLKLPDAAAHTGVWADYLTALQASDVRARELWNAIQADPVLANHTDLLITHDHGRHLDGVLDGFVSHGDGCEGCRRIALLALGPDFSPGRVVATGGELVDVPPTVAAILGFPLPATQGRRLAELFP